MRALSRRVALSLPFALCSLKSAEAFGFGEGGAFHPRLLRAGNHLPLGVRSSNSPAASRVARCSCSS